MQLLLTTVSNKYFEPHDNDENDDDDDVVDISMWL